MSTLLENTASIFDGRQHPKSSDSFARASDGRLELLDSEADIWSSGRLTEYQVIGRHLPTETNPTPKLYRMRIFAPNTVVAKSRFWYFLMKLRKVKKSNGEIVSLNVIHEKRPMKVKNFGIWIRYDSRSGTHNMYKEYREMSRTDAVEALYQDMAARHRARFRSIHILRVVELENADQVKRPYIKQLISKNLKFPLPHRVPKSSKKIFAVRRPATFA
ncbi:60S ribosomal protein L20-B [Endocarpon pusillum Z07020]|uniref:60S ribosomal protein L20-B n=1 Tax=Endocarpon pusillum (strain Z07020 / HMAS-L-300199) TaxID=1263415 RepID=U1G112_ENDPU|nr:60S ribosomal protein L20-B [Endocarpon pusillum Z07020]ERF70912.1 60S ribosomal protein L20-B [Endocarpon pusillum Z07020]